MSIKSVDYVCSLLHIQNHSISVDEVTAPPESPTSLSIKVNPDDNTTNLPIYPCEKFAKYQEGNGVTTSTIANTPVCVVPQASKIQILRKQRPFKAHNK